MSDPPPPHPTSILIVLSFLCAHPVYKLKGTLSEGKSSQQLRSRPCASISSTTERTCECVRGRESRRRKVIGAWWNGGGSKKQDAWWPESFRKQLARCYTNFRTDLISCYQSCRTLCSARLQMCLWGFFSPSVEFFLLIAFTHLTERAVKCRYAEQQIVLFIKIQ